MRTKKLTLILVIFAIFVLLLVLCSTLFALEGVKVNLLDNSTTLLLKQQEIIQSASFDYGKNVFFINKQNYINNIEKNIPEVRVVNLEIMFPNKLIVNCVERTKFLCYKTDGKVFVLDKQLKIMQIINEEEYNFDYINLNVNIEEVGQVGEFVKVNQDENKILINTFYAFFEWNNSEKFLKSKINAVKIDKNNMLIVTTKDNKNIKIKNASDDLNFKLNVGFSAYCSEIMEKNDYVLIYKNQDGKIVAVAG